MRYPNINNKDFYTNINNIYKKYKIAKSKKSYDNVCNNSSFELQLPQQFLANFINPATPYKGILIFHKIGSGKTCTAIQIAEKWKHIKKIIIVLPAALKNNFRNELRSQCGGNNYLKPDERKILKTLHPLDDKYIDIINKSDDRIDKYYNIYSYNKFISLLQLNKIKLNNNLLIIDEIQNMISETGVYYNELYQAIYNTSKDLRIVLLTATPMIDKPQEIALTLNLLKLETPIPTGINFEKQFLNIKKNNITVKNSDKFKSLIKGYISYFKGAPSYLFPKVTIKYVYCVMSKFQYEIYKTIIKNESKVVQLSSKMSTLPNNFFIGTRMVSNIVFPNKKTNDEGLKSLTPEIIKRKLYIYSIKFYNIINKILHSKGKIFIYSSFKQFGGIKSLIKILESIGYRNYMDGGEGKNVFAIWSGDETQEYKEEIKTIYNNSNNLNGDKIKILLGSPSIKEGISLTSVRQVHIIEPYWNNARIAQIIGRASRLCSHKDLPEDNRTVKVYIYIAINYHEMQTIDEYILKLSNNKFKIIKQFEQLLKESAIDCYLNSNADTAEKIICDT